MKGVKSCNRKSYPVFKTLLASLIKDCKLVPIKERQKIPISTDPLAKLVWAISPGVTYWLTATRSNECILTSGNFWASFASPQPKSATTIDWVFFSLEIEKSVIKKNYIYT